MESIHCYGSFSVVVGIDTIIPKSATSGYQVYLYIVEELYHEDEKYHPDYNKCALF